MCVVRKQCEQTLNAVRAARDLAECFPMEHSSDQERRTEKVKSRLSLLSEEKMKKRLDDQYAEFSRAWVKQGTVDPTEENVQKWREQAYPKDSDGNNLAAVRLIGRFPDSTKGLAKIGPRIRCPVHLREKLKKFHELLYKRGFIEQ